MKKRNAIKMMAMVLALGISGTCVACGTSGQEEQKQEKTTEVKNVEKKTTDNKKENEKVQGNVLSDAKVDTVEADADKKSETENVSSETETSSANAGNVSVTNATTGNLTGNSGSTSSGNNTGSTGRNTGNSSGNSSSTPSGNNASNNNSNNAPAQTAHTHTWVHVEATGHYETVVIQDAWDEEVPVYANVEHSICNQCGADITNDPWGHLEANLETCWGYHSEWRYEQKGTQKVHHDAVTEQRWVQDSPAYDVCSGCGATK